MALLRTYGVPIFVALVVVILSLFLDSFGMHLASVAATLGLAAVGLSLLIGPMGRGEPFALSFGQSAFLALGAYGSAVAQTKWGMNYFLGIAVAMMLAAVVAAAIGALGTRLGLFGLGLVTFGMAYFAQELTTGDLLLEYTHSDLGLILNPITVAGIDFTTTLGRYFLTTGALVVGLVLAVHIRNSRFGESLRIVMHNRHVAAAFGVNVARQRVIMFVIAALYATVAGALLAATTGLVDPELVGAMNSIDLVAMVVLGGAGTLLGPVVGAVGFEVLPQRLSGFAADTEIIWSVALLVVLVFAPTGLVGLANDLVHGPVGRKLRRSVLRRPAVSGTLGSEELGRD